MDKLHSLIQDINPSEIASHIERGNLGDWCSTWREAVQDALQPKTNADRIRGMSDEELCEFLMHDAVCDQNMTPDCVDCESCVLGWLSQPAQPTPDAPDTHEHSGLLAEE